MRASNFISAAAFAATTQVLGLAALPLVLGGCDALLSLAHARDAEVEQAALPIPLDPAPARIRTSAIVPLLPPARPPDPGQELDALVMARVEGYPADGTYPFHWPGPDWRGTWAGTTADVHYRGEVIATADGDGRTYCCGVTFEVALGALTDAYAGPVPNLSAMDAYRLRLGFCGDDKSLPSERLAVDALIAQGLGTAVADNDARAGDFVQFWRRGGSGHSAVFIDWLYDDNGRREGIQYWSSQASTGGVGFHAERFGRRQGIDRKRVHLVRLHAPVDDIANPVAL